MCAAVSPRLKGSNSSRNVVGGGSKRICRCVRQRATRRMPSANCSRSRSRANDRASPISSALDFLLGPEEYRTHRRSLRTSLESDGRVFNLHLEIGDTTVQLAANVHADLKDVNTIRAQTRARSFFPDRRESESLLTRIFQQTIDHVAGNI